MCRESWAGAKTARGQSTWRAFWRGKREAINNLDKYLLQFEQKVLERGGHVFWAATGDEACAYIKDLAVRRGVKTVVKSKSMVTEEMHLAPVLEEQGIRVWETDLGEFV